MGNFSLGGFIQLPLPLERITWGEYKAKYGIDLDMIFEVVGGNPDFRVLIRKDVNKPMMISGIYEYLGGGVGRDITPSGEINASDWHIDEDADKAYLMLEYYCKGENGYGYAIKIYADRTIEPTEI